MKISQVIHVVEMGIRTNIPRGLVIYCCRCVVILLSACACVCVFQEQQTALHISARLGNVDNVALLLQHGAQPNATSKDLCTALHITAKEGHEDVAVVLLDHGADQALLTKVTAAVM